MIKKTPILIALIPFQRQRLLQPYTVRHKKKYVTKTYSNAVIFLVNGTSEFVDAVLTGKADAAVNDGEIAAAIVKVNSDLVFLNKGEFVIDDAVVFNSNEDALRAQFNTFLSVIKSDGDLWRREKSGLQDHRKRQ